MGKENGVYFPEEVNCWYETEQLENGVIAIGEPHHVEEVYCYLIQGKNRDLLIDTGMGIKPLKPVIERFTNMSSLIVANSHWHFDHIGGNKEFDHVLVPDNKYEVGMISRGWNKEQLSRYGFIGGFWHGEPDKADIGNFFLTGYKKVEPVLKEGYQINLGNRMIRVLETPGHTPGGVSFFDETFGLLFTADILYEGPLYCFEEESDLASYYASLLKIKSLGNGVKVIHPGHNYSSNEEYPNIVNEAIELFERAMNRDKPDATLTEADGVVEYHCKEEGRRLKLITR